MNKHIYDKSDKGREEMATRKYHLTSKLRSLLLMIDGHRSVEVLAKSFGPMGMSTDNINELLDEGMIVLIDAGPSELPAATRDLKPAMTPAQRQAARLKAQAAGRALHGDDYSGPDTLSGPPSVMPGAAPAAPAGPAGMSDAERHMAVQEFYTQTIKSTLGLRGMMLQLKVEKCSGLDDFRALRDTYVEAVLKAKGREMALSLSTRLDQLLGIGERGL